MIINHNVYNRLGFASTTAEPPSAVHDDTFSEYSWARSLLWVIAPSSLLFPVHN
jgi:hypothetical protein